MNTGRILEDAAIWPCRVNNNLDCCFVDELPEMTAIAVSWINLHLVYKPWASGVPRTHNLQSLVSSTTKSFLLEGQDESIFWIIFCA